MRDSFLSAPPMNIFLNERLFHWRLSMKRHHCTNEYGSGATHTIGRTFSLIVLVILAMGLKAFAQQIPDVTCHTEDYPVAGVVTYWQSPDVLKSVQVVVLKDPAGEQEARFDLTHGGTLISLRYHGREVTYGKPGGANVSMYIPRRGTEDTLKGLKSLLVGTTCRPGRIEHGYDVYGCGSGLQRGEKLPRLHHHG